MGGIFISYRRDESGGYAGRLRDALSHHFGAEQVFRDIDSVDPGERFPRLIEQEVGSCDALLALIGPAWLSITDDAGRRRLDNPDDFVRLEIATALARGDDVLVIPVLFGATSMPAAADLPKPLAGLAERNAVRITDENWDSQVARLTSELEKVVERPVEPSRRHLFRRGRVVIAGIVAAALTAVLAQAMTGWMGIAWRFIRPEPTEQDPIAITVKPPPGYACDQYWMIPQPPQSLPPPPTSTDTSMAGEDWSRWAEQVNGVPTHTSLLLNVQGRTDTQVTITGIEFQVHKRDPAFAGTYAFTNCGAGGRPFRGLQVNLDKQPPQVIDVQDEPNVQLKGGDFPSQNVHLKGGDFPYQITVSKSDTETFVIDAQTDTCDCTWTGELKWTSIDRTGSLPIDNKGAPFRTTSSKLADHACQSVMATHPWNCSPCSGPQESRCFG